MSNETRPRSKNRLRTKEHNDKSTKNDGSKMQISSKESKEKKSISTRNISTKKDRKSNESIKKEELQKLMKKNSEEIYRNKIAAIERNVHLSNSIDKLRQPLSSTSKSNSTSAAKQYSEKSINKLEALKSKRNSIEKVRKLDTKKIPEESNYSAMRKLRSDKSSSKHIIGNSIDKTRRSSLVTKSSKSNYQNLKSSKLPPSEIIPSPETPPTCSKHFDEYTYEDDFEEYSDDFEEETGTDSDKNENSDGGENIEGSKKNKQNFEATKNSIISRIGTSNTNATANDESFINSPLLHRIMNRRRCSDNVQPLQIQSINCSSSMQRKIDFTNATTVNLERMFEVGRRYKMLKNLIGMEIVQIDLLDHHQIRAYDFYVQMFGNKNYIQVQTQTGDDDLDCYVQTEEVDKETIWTQIPYSDSQGWGIVNISNDTDHRKHFNIEDSEIEHFKISHFKMEKFRKFISVAGQVFIDLMQSSPDHVTKLSFEYRTSFKLSTGYNKFSLGNLVNTTKITTMLHRENQLFIAFYIKQTSNEYINNRSIIVEFDICIPHSPQRILLCHNEVQCLCTSPDGTSAIFAGLNDGSCMAYDLRESNSLFTEKLQWNEDGEMYPLRTAAYDTSFKAVITKDFGELDQFAIVAISIVHSDINNSETYQLVSVNEAGTAIIWAIINENTNRMIDYDLGLRPGAQLRMTQISIIHPNGVFFSNLNPSRKTIVNCMTMVPINPAQFLLGTNRGIITSFVSSKAIKLIGPRMYRNDFDIGAEVICISFSSESTFFLAGFSNGYISLHEISNAQPVFNIETPKQARQSLLQVFFSPSNSTIFYTIHRHGLFLVWDLAKHKKPESINDINLKDGHEMVTAELWPFNVASSKLNITLLAIGFNNGEVQLHSLSKSLINCDSKKQNKSLANVIKAYKDL